MAQFHRAGNEAHDNRREHVKDFRHWRPALVLLVSFPIGRLHQLESPGLLNPAAGLTCDSMGNMEH